MTPDQKNLLGLILAIAGIAIMAAGFIIMKHAYK